MDVQDTTKNEERKQLEAFNAIVSFVNDLWEAFGNVKKASPLALYHRLITGITTNNFTFSMLVPLFNYYLIFLL